MCSVINTKFTKFDSDFPSKWSMFFHAGTEWLQTLELLDDEKNKETGMYLFWVYPHIIFFSLELFIKSLVAFKTPSADMKTYGHRVTKIIEEYRHSIPMLEKMSQDKRLIATIREYENTVDTRFGDTSVQMNGEETKLMIDIIYELRNELSRLTGLR